jgi:Flp pilus assembly protein TadG
MRTLRNERGSVLVFMTLMIVLLLIMVGLGLDTGQLTYVRNQGQAAVDAAALSAVSGLPQAVASNNPAEVESRAVAYNSKNDYVESPTNPITKANVSYVTYDFATNTITDYNATLLTPPNGVRVALEAANGGGITTPMFLTPLLNLFGSSASPTQDVNVSAVAVITAKPAIPIALWSGRCGDGTLQTNVTIEMQHPDQNDAGENACWTTFFDCSSGAPDIKAGFDTASNCSGSSIDGAIGLNSMICQNRGQVNTVMKAAEDFFLKTPSNAGLWWIIPVIGGGGNCDPTNPTKITDFAKIQVTAVNKTGSPKFITANIQCGQTLNSLNSSLCFNHRLVREKAKGM